MCAQGTRDLYILKGWLNAIVFLCKLQCEVVINTTGTIYKADR